MADLSFSVIARAPGESELTDALVERFTKEHYIPVHIQDLTWNTARQELNRMATYNEGADVSQIGSTWLRGLVDMNAVRPFSATELSAFGDPSDFVPAAWESACLDEQRMVWAMPWLVDARILFYRRDLLKSAGIDESTAFTTPQALDETLHALRVHGVDIPWVLPSQFSWRTLHAVASWVWDNAGDFVSQDGKHFLFAEAPALTGFRNFFDLARHLVEEARGLSDVEADALFMEGKAAVTISGPWIMDLDESRRLEIGVAAPPGPAFVGGSHLIIWKHTANAKQALQLVEYLTSLEGQRNHGFHGLLPARLEALNTVDSPSRDFSRYLEHVLLNGRAFPAIHLWALIEDHLNRALAQVWEDVLALPEITDSALDEILERRLLGLAKRLKMMFI